MNVPDPHDFGAWKTFTDDAALQARWTGHSNQLNFDPMPRYHRVKTNFTDEVHEYYFDGRLVNAHDDPDRWPSPSSIEVFPEFDETNVSFTCARAAIRRVLLALLFPPPDEEKGEKRPEGWRAPKIDALWTELRTRSHDLELLVQVCEQLTALCPTAPPGESINSLIEAVAVPSAATEEQFADLQSAVVKAVAADFVALWDAKRKGGSRKHEGFDLYVQHEPVPERIQLPMGFKRAMALLSVQYDVFGTEVPIADEEAHVIGCFDLLLIDRQTGELIVADFKNCGTQDLRVGGKGYGTHPFTKHLLDSKFNHYRFQVSFYRHILEKHYFPGRMSKTCILINIDPATPEDAQVYWLEAMDMDPFWRYLLQRLDKTKPVGEQQNNDLIFRPILDTLVAPVPDTDPRCVGPVRSMRLQRGSEPLPANVIWTQRECKSKGFPPLPASEWAHPETTWFGNAPVGVAESYEVALLNNPKWLLTLRDLVLRHPKELIMACWCRDDAKTKCNGEVLTKYGNLIYHDAVDLSPFDGLSALAIHALSGPPPEEPKTNRTRGQKRGPKGEPRVEGFLQLVRLESEDRDLR
jgi:hypothetical protein